MSFCLRIARALSQERQQTGDQSKLRKQIGKANVRFDIECSFQDSELDWREQGAHESLIADAVARAAVEETAFEHDKGRVYNGEKNERE